jgi:predicted unusual protein kinase regulating ubiquinone biosynthesis (AarF/ABC1/UbiB family)
MLYDEANREVVVLDWALTGRLSRDDRRQLARLMIMMTLRDSAGVRSTIHALSRGTAGDDGTNTAIIDRCVTEYFDELPFACSLGALDAMRLLDRIGVEGVRFSGSLVLIRKVMFTLDGVLHDITGGTVRIDTIVTREFLSRWLKKVGALPGPFTVADYLAVQRSALMYVTGLWSLNA